jgi:dTDP-4-amino-4,6-dideoxygalactose transaminase
VSAPAGLPDRRPIPLVDLALQHREIASEVRAGFDSVIERGGFVGGAEVAIFETEFASYCGVANCVGVGNGTDALELLLRAHGVGDGDEIVVPANTFVATVEAVVRTGARPVLADVDPVHLLLDPGSAARVITSRTRALLPVHLYGQIAPMKPLRELASAHGLLLFEDSAQAHGARQDGSIAGALADGAAFSFYPGKNLGAYGDAGAVVTDDDAVAHTLRLLRDHGSHVRYEHEVIGFNSRLDTLQAVVLSAKLRRLDAWNAERRVAAERYTALLDGLPDLIPPSTAAGNEHVWHLYVVRVPERDAVLAALQRRGIGAAVHYPRPVHLHRAFEHLGGRTDLRVAETAAKSVLSLPIYPGITRSQQTRVVEVLADALELAA